MKFKNSSISKGEMKNQCRKMKRRQREHFCRSGRFKNFVQSLRSKGDVAPCICWGFECKINLRLFSLYHWAVTNNNNFTFLCHFFLFLTHGYSVGVAVSYSWDLLICMKFCSTMVIVLNPQPALLDWFVYKESWSTMFTSNFGTGSPSF